MLITNKVLENKLSLLNPKGRSKIAPKSPTKGSVRINNLLKKMCRKERKNYAGIQHRHEYELVGPVYYPVMQYRVLCLLWEVSSGSVPCCWIWFKVGGEGFVCYQVFFSSCIFFMRVFMLFYGIFSLMMHSYDGSICTIQIFVTLDLFTLYFSHLHVELQKIVT